MKPASLFRTSFMTGCAAFALCAALNAQAADSPAPSIEIHLDALSALSRPEPTMGSVPASPAAEASPFHGPTPPPATTATAEKPAETKHAKAKHHEMASAEKPVEPKHSKSASPHHHEMASAEKPAEPKHKKSAHADVASAENPAEGKHAKKAAHHEVVASAETPAPAKHSKKSHAQAPEIPKKDIAEDAIPQPEVKTLVKEQAPSALPPLPSAAPQQTAALEPTPVAGAPDVPKLPAADLPPAPKPAPAKKEGMLSGIAGGFSDLLGGDSDKPGASDSAPQKQPAKKDDAKSPSPLSQDVPPAPAHAEEMPLPGKTPEPSAAALASPPPDLSSQPPVAAADKDLPSSPPMLAPSSGAPSGDGAMPPALTSDAGRDAGKMVVASNEPPPLNSPKADLPSLPSSQERPQEMAQSTLTPLSVPPSAPAAQPELPAAATPEPAQSAPTPPPAPVSSAPAPATPEPAASAPPPHAPATAALAPAAEGSGAKPDVRLAFNENETEIPLGSTSQLDSLANTLRDNPNARVNIMAYASGPDTAGIYPKRVSLARGIAVRNYLTTVKGIDIERVNVKALGNKNEGGGSGDRVDLFVLK